ncbi:MAG: PAS domain S-box protein [Cyclobacteriaceae bacterium]|nr:PAS domain S-box protein [Cyclobacteriaceae bacterium]
MPTPNQLQDTELLNTLIEISSAAVWVYELTTHKRYWLASVSNRNKYNIPASDPGAGFWLNNVHPDDITRATREIDRAIADKSVNEITCEYRFRGSDNWHYISDKIQVKRNHAGEATRLMGSWTDITERIEKEKEARNLLDKISKDRNRFKIISEFSNSVMWEVDLITNKIYWTSGTRTLEDFGLNKEDYSMEDWKQSIHPEDAAASAARFDKALKTIDTTYSDEYRFIKPNGKIAYVIDRGIIIRDGRNNPIRAIGGWIDITALKEREQELTNALKRQEKLIEELASREEELAGSEEELRQVNEQLFLTNKALAERDELMSRSQQLAKIGSWQYDPVSKKFTFSDEIYNIYDVDSDENVSTVDKILRFYDTNAQNTILHLLSRTRDELEPFDFTTQIVTPVRKNRWVRICGWPVNDALSDYPRVIGLTYDVTYFKEAEELLRSSEQKFSRAFHNNADLMVMFRKEDWVIVDINEKIFSTLGYTRKELLGVPARSITFFVHQADREHFFSEMEMENQVEMEAELYCKDNSIKHALLTFNTIEFYDKQHIIATIKDISDRKAAEEKFSKAFEMSPDLMLIFRESDFTLVECNSKIKSISGYTRNEIVGKKTDDIPLWAIEEDRQLHNKIYFEGIGSANLESTFLRKDGSTFFGAISTTRILLAGEQHMLVTVRDITEKKIAEQKLLQSEANLYATINNTSLLVWSVDLEYKVIKANKPFIEYIKKHYNCDVKQGHRITPPDARVDERLRKIWAPRYERALAGEQFKLTSQHDSRHVEFSISPVLDNQRIIGISVFAEDITQRVEQEEALKEAFNKIAELKLTMLRSAMNPHFIFNALNSIQFFIAQNDRKNAISYLSTFSRLVRSILTHSVSNKISLRDETEQLKHYITLEKIRFENKFDYTITIDEELDLDGTEIPPLLIQPYVENAILHGLYNKEGNGHLDIRILKEGNTILFEVHDDGVGRVVAQALREKNFPGHKSMGTALTEERLRLINTQFKVSFEIHDLYNDAGEATGTLVKVWLNR